MSACWIQSCSELLLKGRFILWQRRSYLKPLVGMVFGQLHAFPVHRGTADTSAIRTALQILRDNKLLGIFPEGTRNKGEELLPFHSGAAMLAQRTQSPIVPVLIRGTEKLRFRQKIEVLVGRPIQPKEGKKATKEELAEINNLIFEQFTRLNRQEFKA